MIRHLLILAEDYLDKYKCVRDVFLRPVKPVAMETALDIINKRLSFSCYWSRIWLLMYFFVS